MRTPLHAWHVKHRAHMGSFAGWEMPIWYKGIIAEHLHTRARCSIFDTCHMGQIELSGPTATDDLEYLMTCEVVGLEVGRCRYGYLLNERGGVLDDAIALRLEPDRWLVVVNAATRVRDVDWIRNHVRRTTQVVDRSESWGKIDVQGPEARDAVHLAFGQPLPQLPYFGFTPWAPLGIPCLLSRTGYTGEFGYELYAPADRVFALWERLTAVPGVEPAGLGARDTLRMEMGYPLYGHELDENRSPVAVSGGRFISLAKRFIGCDTIGEELARGRSERLVGLLLEGRRAARPGAAVACDGTLVGRVTSGCYAPSLGRAAALAFVRSDVDAGTLVDVDAGAERLRAVVTELPLYRRGSVRSTV